MNKALIIVAFYKEINEPANQVGRTGHLSKNVDMHLAGVGLNDFNVDMRKYDRIYNVGTCGTLPGKAKVGDIIFPTETGELLKQLQNYYGLTKYDIECRQGVCKTMEYVCEKVPTYLPDYKYIDIIDMEYEFLLKLCLKANKPLIAVKVVSDTIGRKHKDIDVCVKRQQRTIKTIIKNIRFLEEK